MEMNGISKPLNIMAQSMGIHCTQHIQAEMHLVFNNQEKGKQNNKSTSLYSTKSLGFGCIYWESQQTKSGLDV